MHVSFTRVNKIEAMYGRSRVNIKLNLAQLLRIRAAFNILIQNLKEETMIEKKKEIKKKKTPIHLR